MGKQNLRSIALPKSKNNPWSVANSSVVRGSMVGLFNEKPYLTPLRDKIDFASIKSYLSSKEISCVKYNYNLDVLVQNADHYFATLQISKDGKQIIFNNLKPRSTSKLRRLTWTPINSLK